MSALGKRLAYLLRHDPAAAGVQRDPEGWVATGAALDWLGCSQAELVAEVAADAKGRFQWNATQTALRAVQGHSYPVDLGWTPVDPPAVLYHGTQGSLVPTLLAQGLLPMTRQHVHLAADVSTAIAVGGRRRGDVAVLRVDAARLAAQQPVFRAVNGVYLTTAVPPTLLAVHRRL